MWAGFEDNMFPYEVAFGDALMDLVIKNYFNWIDLVCINLTHAWALDMLIFLKFLLSETTFISLQI